MKRTDENRYPQSAELFKFCKEALNIKHNFAVKVIDQHVGAILGFDPADCSHWKKGKKNIKALDTVKAIAQHLDADERDILDIISGRKNLEEALEEYKGFGQTTLSLRQLDELKREYFRNTARYQSFGIHSFDEFTDTKRSATQAAAEELLLRARVSSLPVMLPEVTEILDTSLVIQASDSPDSALISVEQVEGRTIITYRAGDMKPYLRFLIAREIGRHVLMLDSQLSEEQSQITDLRLNIFASALLMPSSLVQSALRHTDPSCDLIDQLAVLFWLPRSIVAAQLKDFIVQTF